MKKTTLLFTVLIMVLCASAAFAQPSQPQMLKRTITKNDRFDFGSGGTLAITGAPVGSISIVSGTTNEIEIVAQIELQAPTEAGLSKLAEVTGFVTEESGVRTGIVTVGTHAKAALKKADKKFPKELIGLPFRVDYVITVPRYCDLEIDGGVGDLTVKGVEGSMYIKYLESNAKLDLIAGGTNVVIGKGSADIALAARGWRGRSVNVQVGIGDLVVHLPTNLSADIDVIVLRNGKIENHFPDIKPRDRKVPFTDMSILGRTRVSGPSLKFGVGDGNIKMYPLDTPL